jgi:hypothetical protein
MEEPIKDLNKIFEEYSKQYFTPEIEIGFLSLGKYYDTYDFIRPFLKPSKFDDVEFYILDKYLDNFRESYKNHRLVDENYKVLNNKTSIAILKEYGKGFRESYFSFKNPLKPHIPKNIDGNRKLISEIYAITASHQPNGRISSTLITNRKIIQELEESYYHSEFYQVTKKSAYTSGYNGGKLYKAWEIILENRPLFNEIFKKKAVQNRNFYSPKPNIETKTIEIKKEIKTIETPELKLSGIPKFNLPQRYYLFQKLGFDETISKIKTDKQGNRNKILALIMGISVDNAKHSTNGTYKQKLTLNDLEEIEYFLYRNKIEL